MILLLDAQHFVALVNDSGGEGGIVESCAGDDGGAGNVADLSGLHAVHGFESLLYVCLAVGAHHAGNLDGLGHSSILLFYNNFFFMLMLYPVIS